MSGRLTILLLVLGIAIGAVSTIALLTGIDETRLALGGPRKDVDAAGLGRARGYLAVFGCVRHDLAVGVGPSGYTYALGEGSSEGDRDRVFTPLAAAADCDEDKKPGKLYALVEDDDALGTTISHIYKTRVAPPPVQAVVIGVAGYGAGHSRAADRARAFLADHGTDVRGLPLIAKGKRPGVLWVAATTALAGAHGWLVVALGVWWAIRRRKRRRALLAGHTSDAEEEFFRSETLD